MRDVLTLACFCLLAVYCISEGAGAEDLSLSESVSMLHTFSFIPEIVAEKEGVTFNFYKVSRNLVIVFFMLFAIMGALVVQELLKINREEEAGQAKWRLQADLESQTRRNLKDKLEEKNRQLTVAAMALEEKNKILTKLKSNLQHLHAQADDSIQSQLRPLNHSIDRNLKSQDDWVQFQLHFSQVHPHFFSRLKAAHPSLNTNDLRLCAYLRLQLSTKEVASLMHINHNSVQKARYRLKKKLALLADEDLLGFIAKI